MAIMTNQANLTYTYGTTTATVLSNLAETEWNTSLSVEKRALEEAYREGSTLTYLVSLKNSGGQSRRVYARRRDSAGRSADLFRQRSAVRERCVLEGTDAR